MAWLKPRDAGTKEPLTMKKRAVRWTGGIETVEACAQISQPKKHKLVQYFCISGYIID
jgi:hypothetical protein